MRPARREGDAPGDPAFEVRAPDRQTGPFVFASPHSGTRYPPAFLRASPLDPLTLRRSEDSFVDELFAAAPRHGAPLIRALFPRAYIDPNREPFELDPAMFEDSLPDYANTQSSRVAAGLGTIARVVANGQEIYGEKLRFADAVERINRCYRPYHKALEGLVEATAERFGAAVLIDCHSMPSVGGPMDPDAGRGRADIILGDCFGTACAAAVSDSAERALRDLGFRVIRNKPFAGGFTTRHYGRPSDGRHALQIEINRALYMNERRIERGAGFAGLAERLTRFVAALIRLPVAELRAR
ncbi:MAG: N-formylglutamate amidohydrolase [Alphaproteobacteria bacterium]|nr:N-formylglutamate amidohydrolase [Alphaproteobacteria bacterium]